MRRHRARILELLLLLGSVLGALFAAELALRVGIAQGVPALRDPDLFGDPQADDDWWKLHHSWVQKWPPPTVLQVDWLLGWSIPPSPENPLGVLRALPYHVDLTTPTVLFYGDSFVFGAATDMPHKIPQVLETMLPGRVVYNYGIGGYGVDQIYLRFLQSHRQFARPSIVFGILTYDVDRCVLSVRSGQKPYFLVENDRLVLRGVPIGRDPRAWLDQNPPRVHSYLLALLRRRTHLLLAGGNAAEVCYRQNEKQRITSRILDAVVREVQNREIPLLFVLFYTKEEFASAGWRELYLKQEMARLAVPVVDTKDVFLRAARERNVGVDAFYDGGHPNSLGNRLIAEAITPRLESDP